MYMQPFSAKELPQTQTPPQSTAIKTQTRVSPKSVGASTSTSSAIPDIYTQGVSSDTLHTQGISSDTLHTHAQAGPSGYTGDTYTEGISSIHFPSADDDKLVDEDWLNQLLSDMSGPSPNKRRRLDS